ncbi:MAG: hypothetical protein M1834_008383 [Cirrosporium novae-zelandiae]|nr:MAG: hypothetical protein M1834_008383 [Cirrosporium novae-zelandiae]
MIVPRIFYYYLAVFVAIGSYLYITITYDYLLDIHTTSGEVKGFIEYSTPGVRQFLGIPFAEPPIEDLRWQPPKPKRPAEPINATSFSPSCPQFQSSIPSVYSRDVQELIVSGETSEDCLFLSIWTPVRKHQQRGSSGLPVLVWIYGGAFTNGGGNTTYQIPSKWVQRSQNHIVVQINYRLNIFGFPNARGLKDQNLGFLDQRLGLEWVRDNIAKFGGDPARIVLWGQSAGASSVDIQNFAFPQDPIVSGFIMDSGSALLPLKSEDHVQANFSFVAENLGCASKDAEAELGCMRKIPQEQIESFLQKNEKLHLGGSSPKLSFIPIPDEALVFSDYTKQYKDEKFTSLPAIIGTTSNEGSALAPYSPDGPNQDTSTTKARDMFLCPAVKSSRLREAAGRPTFRYVYDGNFTNISPLPWMGAYHSSELPLLFGSHSDADVDSTPFEYCTSHTMQDLWLEFIKDPIEGLPKQDWKPYSSEDGNAIVFGRGNSAMQFQSIGEIDSICDDK